MGNQSALGRTRPRANCIVRGNNKPLPGIDRLVSSSGRVRNAWSIETQVSSKLSMSNGCRKVLSCVVLSLQMLFALGFARDSILCLHLASGVAHVETEMEQAVCHAASASIDHHSEDPQLRQKSCVDTPIPGTVAAIQKNLRRDFSTHASLFAALAPPSLTSLAPSALQPHSAAFAPAECWAETSRVALRSVVRVI